MGHFPDDFLWGASVAAHQVEGNTDNQWSRWEHQHAGRLAATAEQRLGWLPRWDAIAAQASDPANYISGDGVAHYQRYHQDFALLEQLHMNSLRCGIEWSRLEPTCGTWDAAAIAHYTDYIDSLNKRGITPILTLWHWTMPGWFADMGGFAHRRNLAYFARFVQKVAELFGDKLSYVITCNEPNVYVGLSYGTGEWPPQQRNPFTALRVYSNLVRAHKQAYRILKQANPALQVGIAAQLADVRPLAPRQPLNRAGVAAKQYVWNWWFLDRIRQHQDFIGVNYYFTEYQNWHGAIRNPAAPSSDLGWYMEPAGIERILRATWQRYRTPLIITENGLADSRDTQRQWWIAETLPALRRALASGVQLKGYLHWSLLDNFEWAYGWWPQFGLVHVDRHTMQRTIRPSAQWLAQHIARSHTPAQHQRTQQ